MIGTPGRILDHLVKTEVFGEGLKGRLEWVVLDEADRLLDMGLGKQVRREMRSEATTVRSERSDE